jgi:hypothetical protein
VTVSAGSNTAPSITTVGDTNTGIFFPAADTIAFSEGGVEAARFDSAGNLGLGVTPSAWGSSDKAIDIGGGNQSSISANLAGAFATNAYFNGTDWKYKNTLGNPGLYSQSFDGQHKWFRASSGTAGNTISFTQAMTLDASGNLGVGATSPGAKLQVAGVQTITSGSGAGSANGLHLWFNTGTNTAYIQGYQSGVDWRPIVYNATQHVWQITDVEKARIDSSGNFQVVSGQTNLVGGLSVGTSSLQGSVIYFGSSVIAAGAGTYPLKWNSSTGVVTYDTSSRLVKENIEDSPYGLTEVLQLKSRKYHRTDDQRDEIGLVADEVQAVMPEFVPLVAKSIFTKDEADTELIAGGVNYDKLTSVLVKAIQEQQAIIQTLTDRITTLEQA